MKVVLLNAVSIDGFIAKKDGDSDWVKDDEQFDEALKEFGNILIGHKTFKQFENDLYPIDGAITYVYTSDNNLKSSSTDNFIYVSGTPYEVLDEIAKHGFDKVLLGGGGQVNATFVKAGLIDEMFLDVHPLILGEGIKLLGDFSQQLKLELIDQKDFTDFVQLHYKVSN